MMTGNMETTLDQLVGLSSLPRQSKNRRGSRQVLRRNVTATTPVHIDRPVEFGRQALHSGSTGVCSTSSDSVPRRASVHEGPSQEPLINELPPPPSIKDFELKYQLGKGAFATVFLVVKKPSQSLIDPSVSDDAGRRYALKVIKKTTLTKKEHEYTKDERNSMAKLDHPFIIKVYYAFQDQMRAYMVLELAEGGDLLSHLIDHEHELTEVHYRFYLAELVLALGHIHSLSIIHRDLKLENILLDSMGHIKLADFGLCITHLETKKLYEQCGTLECQAPEVLNNRGYNKTCDWWSFGVLMYNMLFADFPFKPDAKLAPTDPGRVKTMKKSLMKKVKFPEDYVYGNKYSVSSTAKQTLERLLKSKPEQRLGFGENGFADVKNDPFFDSMEIEGIGKVRRIDWNLLLQKKIYPSQAEWIEPTPLGQCDKSKVTTSKLSKFLSNSKNVNHHGQMCHDMQGFTYREPIYCESSTSIPKFNLSVVSERRRNTSSQEECSLVRRIQDNNPFFTKHTTKQEFADHYEKLEKSKPNKEYYQCEHRVHRRKQCVVKVLPKQSVKTLHTYLDELRIMERISTWPDVSHLVDLFEDREQVYLVVEDMKGGNILTGLTRRGISERNVATIFHKMAKLVDQLHGSDCRIVHSDLRPSKWAFKYEESKATPNERDVIRLCNFQSGTFLWQENSHPTRMRDRFLFLERCDIFSMGVLLYGILVGHHPFDECAFVLGQEAKIIPNEAWDSLSEDARDLLTKMTNLAQDFTMGQVLEHPWLARKEKNSDATLSTKMDADEISSFDMYMKNINTYLRDPKCKRDRQISPLLSRSDSLTLSMLSINRASESNDSLAEIPGTLSTSKLVMKRRQSLAKRLSLGVTRRSLLVDDDIMIASTPDPRIFESSGTVRGIVGRERLRSNSAIGPFQSSTGATDCPTTDSIMLDSVTSTDSCDSSVQLVRPFTHRDELVSRHYEDNILNAESSSEDELINHVHDLTPISASKPIQVNFHSSLKTSGSRSFSDLRSPYGSAEYPESCSKNKRSQSVPCIQQSSIDGKIITLTSSLMEYL